MKIESLHIDGFGVWSDKTWEPLAPGLNVFHGPNETGKSTLMAFIRSVLFGLDRRGQTRRYEPLNGGTHGGWLDVRVGDDSAAIGDRRVFASLHYPSDSLASWIVALSLIPNVFDDDYRDVALPLVSDAIRSSLVYLAIEAHVSANSQSSPYTAAWKRLQSLLKPSTA